MENVSSSTKNKRTLHFTLEKIETLMESKTTAKTSILTVDKTLDILFGDGGARSLDYVGPR